MSDPAPVSETEPAVPPQERARRSAYLAAFGEFSAGLNSNDLRRINGSASPAWEGKRTVSFAVNPESPRYRSEENDPVFAALDELSEIKGSLTKIALWLNDRMAGLISVIAVEQFGIAISRICAAKNPRLEAHLVELALGRSLHGNSNGYKIAGHFGLKPQTFHEALSETCRALNLPKPLAKSNTKRYKDTQYRHHVEKPANKPSHAAG